MNRQVLAGNDFEVLRIRLTEAFCKKDWETVFSISQTIDEIQCALWDKKIKPVHNP